MTSRCTEISESSWCVRSDTRPRSRSTCTAHVTTLAKASASTNEWLDRLGALLFALCIGLLAWRTTLGGLNAWTTNSGTMMLGFPEWIVYTAMVPPLVLATAIGLTQAARGFPAEVHE